MNARQFTRTVISNTLLAAGLAAVVSVATPAHAGLLGQGSGSLGGSLSRGGLEGLASGQGRLEATRPELRRPALAARERVSERAEDAAGRGRGALGNLGQRAGAAGAGVQGEANAAGQATAGAMRPAEMPAVSAPAMTPPTTAPAATADRTPAETNGSMAANGDAQAQASRQGGSAQVQAQGSARASAERRGN